MENKVPIFRVGQKVRVLENHPARPGDEGVITELFGIRVNIGNPRACIRLTKSNDPIGNFAWVSLEYLEVMEP